jgi:hypothetical protein
VSFSDDDKKCLNAIVAAAGLGMLGLAKARTREGREVAVLVCYGPSVLEHTYVVPVALILSNEDVAKLDPVKDSEDDSEGSAPLRS